MEQYDPQCCLCCHLEPLLADTTRHPAIANVGRGEADEDLQEAVRNLKVTLIAERWGVRGETKEGGKTKAE